MKILHILNDGPDSLSESIIRLQDEALAEGDEIKVIDLTSKELSYDSIVRDIFSYDRVISW